MALGHSGPGAMSVESFKGSFFDAAPVLKAMDSATRRVFSRFGSFVRQRARSSLKYGTKPSSPGHPPTVHRTQNRSRTNKKTGATTTQSVSPLRELLFFAYLAQTQSVVIGPARFVSKKPPAGVQTIAEALEKGGTTLVGETLIGGRWRLTYSLDVLQRAKRPTRKVQARIQARTFMAPALAAELPGLVPMYAKSF